MYNSHSLLGEILFHQIQVIARHQFLIISSPLIYILQEMIASHNRQYPIPAPLTLPGAERLMIGEVVCVKKHVVWTKHLTLVMN